VHETGPYGDGHWVWQASCHSPETWPIEESIALMLQAAETPRTTEINGWKLWKGYVDEWGMSFARPGHPTSSMAERAHVWKECMTDQGMEKALTS
jgi:hypothetical protein